MSSGQSLAPGLPLGPSALTPCRAAAGRSLGLAAHLVKLKTRIFGPKRSLVDQVADIS